MALLGWLAGFRRKRILTGNPRKTSPMIRTLVRYDITICGIPELDLHREAGVSDVLSIIDPYEPEPVVFDRFHPHRRQTLRFDDVMSRSAGAQAPEDDHLEALLAFGQAIEQAGDATHLLIHCHAGVSRSTAAAAILMAQHNAGREADAFLALLELRAQAWPNTRMVQIADRLMARNGALIEGLVAYRRALLEVRPHLAEMIVNVGRGNELP
jgi:predicted protein tyrosine phosphatase